MRHSLLALPVVLLACGTPPPTYEADVRPILGASCNSCHVAGGIAPFALTDYETAKTMKDAIRAAVEARTMPPYLASDGCTTYADDQRLSADQISTIAKWAEAGAPRGTPSAQPTAQTVVENHLPQVDLSIEMPVTYTPTKSPDDYRCFVIDWPKTEDTYVTGFNVLPGNPRVVHHVIAFLMTPDRAQRALDLDTADPAPGYECFGGPGGNQATANWLGSWAPGVTASMYPAGTGLLVKPGSKVVLQVHYNTTAAPEGERADQTRVELALASTVQKKAFILPWASPDWARKGLMPIPAGSADVEHTFALDPSQFLGFLSQGQLTSGQGVRMYAAGLHQHLLGSKSRLQIDRADGTKECLLDIPRWDFHWQRSYRFEKTKLLRPGDALRITCHWDNSAPGARDANWGEGTGDEMCLGIMYVSE